MFNSDENVARERLRDLIDDLRTGRLDHRLNAYIAKIENPDYRWLYHIMGLTTFMYESRTFPVVEVRPPTRKYPDEKVLNLLGRFDLEKQLFAYISRFSVPFTGTVARAFEFLQISMFTDWQGHNPSLESIRFVDHTMNKFRLAQKLRNEYGFTRWKSPPDCFQSFEDIVQSERIAEKKDITAITGQCFQLKIVQGHHLRIMFRSTRWFEELFKIYNSVVSLGNVSLHLADRNSIFEMRFVMLMREFTEPLPTWPMLKTYMRLSSFVDLTNPVLLRAVQYSEVNEAINCLLNRLRDCSLTRELEEDSVETLLGELLWRYADLYYRHPDEEMSSIAALVEITQNDRRVNIADYEDLLCCPLKHDEQTRKVIPGTDRVASLFCLSARKLPPAIHIKWHKQLLVEAHQELQAIMDGRPYTPPERISGWEIETSEFFGEYIPLDYPCVRAKIR